jgi:hypothetical protein
MINRTANKSHHSQHRAVVILRSPSPDKAELTSSSTDETCRSFYEAYEHFNEVLFDNQLSGCLFTMQRRKRSRGFFATERFGHRRGNEIVDEIALNPRTFLDRTDRKIISTVVHEMVHQ